MDLKNKKVLFVISSKNFRDEELLEPKELLEGYGANTLVVNENGKESLGMLGTRIEPSMSLNKVSIGEYDAVVFVGGSGSSIYWNDKNALNVAKEAYIKGKVVAAICLASGTLANSGLCKGKKITGWQDTKEIIEKNGGIYTGNDLEISGRLITASGPKAAKKFGEAIAKVLGYGSFQR